MKYVAIEWPDVQDYIGLPDFQEESFYDPQKNVWLIPDWWETERNLEEDLQMN